MCAMIDEIRSMVSAAVGEELEFSVERPKVAGRGQFSTNAAFAIAKRNGTSPKDEAERLKEKIMAVVPEGYFEKMEVAGGFINFWLSEKTINETFKKISSAGAAWGDSKRGAGQKIIVEYGSPNIGKPLHFGHLRSTIIGQALYNIYRSQGYRVVSWNHPGDWGKQFGIMIAAYREKSRDGKVELSIDEFLRLYVEYNARMKEDPRLEEIAREETRKLQAGDSENMRLWRKIYSLSMSEFARVAKRLGVRFDVSHGESFYKPFLKGIVDEALRRGLAVKSEGAIIIPLDEENLPPFVIQKSDEAYLYATTDIAAAKYRLEKYKANKVLYVVGAEQYLHFEQLFAVLKKLGYLRDQELIHIKFGLVLGGDAKKLSTRAGKHISLSEVINEAVDKAGKVLEEKAPEIKGREKRRTAEIIGIDALKYNDLSQNRTSNILFDWEKMLAFEGNAAPYLLYTYARLRSIIKKSRAAAKIIRGFTTEAEKRAALKLSEFPEVLGRAADNCAPHYLAEYLYELSEAMNNFYHAEPVLTAEPEVRASRLALVRTASIVLEKGIRILGLETVERL